MYSGRAVENDGNLNLRGGRELQGCAAGESDVVVTIDADSFPGETSWDIVTAGTSTQVASGGDLTHKGVHTWSNCLPGGDYTFTIYDTVGDGLACDDDDSPKFFSVTVDGIQKFKVNDDSGLDFGESTSRDFTVPTVSILLICFFLPIANILIKSFSLIIG